MSYTFTDHLHNFAVWTAARAAQRNFTSTENISKAIDKSELKSLITNPDRQWTSTSFDAFHKETALKMINDFDEIGIEATYGRVAKIIAIYIKTAVVIRTDGKSQLARHAHPPIDSILLKNLATEFKKPYRKIAWTTLDQSKYWELIQDIRDFWNDDMWKIEEYWSL